MIKKCTVVGFLMVLSTGYIDAQTNVYAYIKDASGKAIEKADVELKGSGVQLTADKIGYFQFVDLQPGNYQLVVSKPAYETQVLDFSVSENEKKKDLGVVTLLSSLNSADLGVALLDNSLSEDEVSTQSTLGLLQSSRDVFSSIASFDLGFYWFRPRGIDGRTSDMMMNGISMANPATGNVNFGHWGGLNEITRYPEVATNHTPSEYVFGAAGGVVYKNTKASEHRKGSQLTYSITNRNYRHRLSYRFSTGMNRKGWAFTGMIARRWAQEGRQEGTFYDAFGGYLGVEKKFNDKHTMTLNVIGSPYRRSGSSPATQEVYDYRGVHYNAYWGWYNGEKRSERVRRGFQPIIQLTDYWKISDKSQLWTTVSYQFGKEKSGRLDWQNVQNPTPVYYRNLPSYWAGLSNPTPEQLEEGEIWRQRWETNDQSYTQINWDNLYRANMAQQAGEYYGKTGKRALYYLVNDVNDDKIWNVGTHFIHNFTDNVKFLLNASYQNYYSNQYREVSDLLGADFVLNRDPFARTNQPLLSGLYNEGEDNVTKKVGDRIMYDFIFRRQEAKINPALKVNLRKWDIFVSALASYTSDSREGRFNNYLYKDSFGKSKSHDVWNFGLKGQLVYKIDGRNYLVYNGAYFSQAPTMNNLFINPRLNDVTTPNIKNIITNANDISYVISAPNLKLRATAFLVNTYNGTNVQRFFADGIRLNNQTEEGGTAEVQSAFVTQVMSNVERRNMGAELGMELKLTPTLSFQGVASYGEYTYQNKPNIYFLSDAIGTFSNGKTYINYGKSYLEGYKQGGTPQEAYSAGLRYNSPKFWWAGINWNYLGANYVDPSAVLRSDFFVNNPNTGTPYAGISEAELRRVTAQHKLPSAHFLNANIGKSWLLGRYYFLVSASVNNILNNKKYITSGFEQTRNLNFADFRRDYDREYPNFAPRYWYTQGRSYFVNVQFRF